VIPKSKIIKFNIAHPISSYIIEQTLRNPPKYFSFFLSQKKKKMSKKIFFERQSSTSLAGEDQQKKFSPLWSPLGHQGLAQ
jgi:hypothetical protein